MSLWVELHCDFHIREGPQSRGILLSICYSDSNDNPGIMFGNASGNEIRRVMIESGKAAGWKRKGNSKKWICPGCQYALEYKKQEPIE